MNITVSSLRIYPVKSTAGLELEASPVEARGLALDRRWMVVDATGQFLSGREHPTLVTVTARPRGHGLSLEAPGQPRLQLEDARGEGPDVPVDVWGERVQARTVGAPADAWFSRLLETDCRLVHLGDHERPVDPEFGQPGDQVSFADAYPLLLVGDASLDDLNTRAPRAASMRRFRPNVTVAGSGAFAEDGWQALRVGSVEFHVPKLCDRCVMTTVDPDTGVPDVDQEPLLTLSRYRRDPARGILFGINLIPRAPGVLRVGDPVEVLA